MVLIVESICGIQEKYIYHILQCGKNQEELGMGLQTREGADRHPNLNRSRTSDQHAEVNQDDLKTGLAFLFFMW